LGLVVNSSLSPQRLNQWGWRIPLFVGCAIIPVLLLLRRSLEESDEFRAQTHHPRLPEIMRSLAANAPIILVGIMMFTMTTVCFYMITAYTPTFGSSVLHFSSKASFLVTLFVGASNLVWLPVMGAASDRWGRYPLLLGCSALMLLTAYPFMSWLVSSPSFSKLVIVELWFSFIYSSYNGAMIVFMTENIPIHVRTVGFSLAYSLATAVFGGFTPAISTYLIHLTNNRAMPGAWMSLAAALALGAGLLARRYMPRTRI